MIFIAQCTYQCWQGTIITYFPQRSYSLPAYPWYCAGTLLQQGRNRLIANLHKCAKDATPQLLIGTTQSGQQRLHCLLAANASQCPGCLMTHSRLKVM